MEIKFITKNWKQPKCPLTVERKKKKKMGLTHMTLYKQFKHKWGHMHDFISIKFKNR